MNLMNEHLARAHISARIAEAERSQRRHRLVAALRAQRRAEQAASRARRLLLIAIAR